MRKQNASNRSIRSKDDVLPAELDFTKLKFVGFGVNAIDRYEAEKARTVVLDKDVAKVFVDSGAVNALLRAVIEGAALSPRLKRKRSA